LIARPCFRRDRADPAATLDHMVRCVVAAVVFSLSLMLTSGAHAGELPTCKPAPSPKSEVAKAQVVVIAKARARTSRRGDDLSTRFTVTQVLRGAGIGKKPLAAKASITVDDCWDWKCQSATFKRGQQVVLLLRAGEKKGHYALPGLSCSNGFNLSALTYDPADPSVQAILDAAAASDDAGPALPAAK
jgi:hypothetical protein